MNKAIIFVAELKKSLNPVVFLLVVANEAKKLQKIQGHGLDHQNLLRNEHFLTGIRMR